MINSIKGFFKVQKYSNYKFSGVEGFWDLFY